MKIQLNNHDFYYRPETKDMDMIAKIFLSEKGEYHTDFGNFKPEVILDIGGNIGITTIHFINLFPNSKIYIVEPMKENYNLLVKNIAPYKNIKAFNIGLGNINGIFPIYNNDYLTNKGSFSLYINNIPEHQIGMVSIQDIMFFLNQNNIDKIDLIKVDCEGAEYDILTSLSKDILKNVKWILGEFHSIKELELIEYLETWFDINITCKWDDLSLFLAKSKYL